MPLLRVLSSAYHVACLLLVGGIVVTSLSLLTACAPRSSLFAEAQAAPAPAPNLSVLQSDVLVVNGQTVRLVDAVTPQPSPDAKCPAEALASRQTALRLKSMISGVHTVTVTPTGQKDAYNRPYAHVLLDGADPAHELIEDGLAVRPGSAAFNWCGSISAGFPRAEHISVLSFSGA
jgi:endonuclease YncB( thermonuclease family)